MELGWIKLHRTLLNKGYYKKSTFVHLWVHCLLRANHKDTEILWNGKTIMLHRGQFITGRNALSRETGINRSSVDRILKFFEIEHQIEQQMSNTSRLISITNYDKHQDIEPPLEPRVSHERATGEPPVSTDKNDKKEKNVKNDKIYTSDFLEFWKVYPKKKGKKKAFKAWRIAKDKPAIENILQSVQSQLKSKDWNKEDGQFIPHPASWLNGGCWDDELDVAAEPADTRHTIFSVKEKTHE